MTEPLTAKQLQEPNRPQLRASGHLISFGHYMKCRRYSSNTIKTYTEAIEQFFKFHADKSPESIGIPDFIDFNTRYILEKKLSASYQNQIIKSDSCPIQNLQILSCRQTGEIPKSLD